MSTAAEKRHLNIVAQTGCVICHEYYDTFTPPEIHHVAAGLCHEHHQGDTGIHGMGVKAFCRLWKLTNEYDLLTLVNKWRAK